MADGEDTAKIIRETEFPIKNPAVRRLFARDDKCPECGGELDTGWECTDCEYDARDEAYPSHVRGKP
jgi:tRNA(Ile2) C34 agmatinyltransferase TiaS